jgi:hypothetical protein
LGPGQPGLLRGEHRPGQRTGHRAGRDRQERGRGRAVLGSWDWRGWAERIEQLSGVIAAAGPAGGNFLVAGERKRLATALAEAATMLAEVETVPAAEVPDDVTGYTAKELWQAAAGFLGGPLVTSFASLSKGIHLSPESARWALVELHKAGRVRLYRYLNGYQIEGRSGPDP